MGMNDKHDYEPTKWVDNSEPDIDAEHLNKIESALQEYGVSIDELAATGGTAAKVKATDTYGLVVSALGESTAQALIDAIANKVVNELINKNKIVNNLLATDESTVLAGPQGAALGARLKVNEDAVAKLNSDKLTKGSLFVVVISAPYDIPGNSSADIRASYVRKGYIALGVVGLSGLTSNCNARQFFLADGDVNVSITNNATANQKGTCNIRVLYRTE